MPVIRNCVVALLSFCVIFGGENKKCECSQLDSLKEIILNSEFYNSNSNSKNILDSTSIEKKFKILFIPPSVGETDSLFDNQFIDTLSKNFKTYGLTDVSCQVLPPPDTTSLFQLINTDSLARKLGEKMGSNLVVWWTDLNKRDNQISIQPSVTVIANSSLSKNTFSSALGQFSNFTLPQDSLSNDKLLVEYLLGFILLKQNKFTDAIKLFKKIEAELPLLNKNDLFCHFYLADCFLRRGKSYNTNITLANADWDTAIHYYQKCLNDSSSMEHKEKLVWVYNNYGVVFQLLGDLESALKNLYRALDYKKNLETDASIIRIYNNIGNIYLFDGQWTKALEIYQTSIKTMEQLSDKKNLADTYDNMGNIYQLIMQNSNAITYYQKGLSLRQELGDKLGMAISYGNLGDVYFEKRDYSQAVEFYLKELTVNKQLHDEPRMARTYDNLGEIYHKIGKIDSAITCFQKSIELMEMIGDDRGTINSSNHLAAVYHKQKELDKALNLYEKSLSLALQIDDEFALAKIYDHMADIYNSQQKLEKALEFYKKSAELHEKLNYTESLALIIFNMGLIYLKQNNYVEGYQLIDRAIKIDEQSGYFNLQNEKEFLRELEVILKK